MMLICSFLNERLVPRYRDDLYITFIDPVPEDKAARNEEMKTGVGGQPVLTVNEARDEFMGLGPVDGGDQLMMPTSMAPVGQAKGDGNIDPNAEGNANADAKKVLKRVAKPFTPKAANGERVAFRPTRTKLQKRAKIRADIGKDLAAKIATVVKDILDQPPRFSTKEQDELAWKGFSERTTKTGTHP